MNVKKNLALISIFFTFCLFWSCSDDAKPKIQEMQIRFLFNGNKMSYNTTYNLNGYNVQFTLVKFYAHFIPNSLESLDDTIYVLSLEANQFILQTPNENATIQESYDLYIGVPANLNTQNGKDAKPAFEYPNAHPLSATQDMYWAWNPGYVFLKLEGRIDISQDGDYEDVGETFSIHTGLDPLYVKVPFAVSMVNNVAQIDFDVNKLFVNYDLANQGKSVHAFNVSHAEYPFAQAITNNLVNAFTP